MFPQMLRVRRSTWLGLLALMMILPGLPAYARQTTPQLTPLSDMLRPDGTLDLPQGFSGSLDPNGLEMTTAPDGSPRFVASVAAAAAGDEQWDNRFGAPGVWDFSSPGKVTALAVAADGSVYVGGQFNTVGAVEANYIARWDGQGWHPMGEGLDHQPKQFAVNGNTLYVVGEGINTAGTVSVRDLARWDGTEWSAIGDGTGPEKVDEFGSSTGALYTVAVIGNDLYVGGAFNHMDGVEANGVARWNGTAWSGLGRGVGNLNFDNQFEGNGDVNALAVSGNKLYAAGRFQIAGTQTVNNIAVWNGSAWSGLGTGVINTDDTFSTQLTAVAASGSNVYVGGIFTKAGTQNAKNIARWDGTKWNALGGGLTKPNAFSFDIIVRTILIDGDSVYAAGSFERAGGTVLPTIARWDGTKWNALGAGITEEYAEAMALARTPEGLYIGGSFRLAGDRKVDSIARWDGTIFNALGQGLMQQDFGDSPAKIKAIAVDGAGRVYVAGQFTRAGGIAVANIAMWDGNTWQGLGSGVDGMVRALAVAGDDLFVAGEFSKAGGGGAQHVARWNRPSGRWSALGSGINGDVYALAYQDGLLYAGGGFTAAGATTAYDLAYWDGAKWNAFGQTYRVYERSAEGGEIGTYVNALAVQGNTVIAGGHFQTIHRLGTDTGSLANYMLVNNVVGWTRSTDTWFVLGPWTATVEPGVTTDGFSGFGTDVNALAIIGGDVYIGGEFNLAGNVAAANIVRWNAPTNTWAALAGGVAGFDDDGLYPTEVMSLVGVGRSLFVGGHFTAAGDTAARFVARWDTGDESWQALGSGLRWYNDRFTYVNAVAATPAGAYIGGDFQTAGGIPSSALAHWVAPVAAGNITAGQGGTLTAGDATVVLPAGAVPANAQGQLTALFAPTQPVPADRGVVQSLRLETSVAGQPVTQYGQPYTLRVSYTDDALAALKLKENELNVLAFNGGAWTPLLPCAGCSVNTQQNVITIVSNRPGELAVVGILSNGGGGETKQKVYLPMAVR